MNPDAILALISELYTQVNLLTQANHELRKKLDEASEKN